MPPLEPLQLNVTVTDLQGFKGLCKAFERFSDQVENVEQFLRINPNQERLTAADQLRDARRDFVSMLDEVS